MPSDTYIRTIQILYTDQIKGLSFIAENGDFRVYGNSDPTFLTSKFSFSEDIQWIGLYGTVSNVPTSLGTISLWAGCGSQKAGSSSKPTTKGGSSSKPTTQKP